MDLKMRPSTLSTPQATAKSTDVVSWSCQQKRGSTNKATEGEQNCRNPPFESDRMPSKSTRSLQTDTGRWHDDKEKRENGLNLWFRQEASAHVAVKILSYSTVLLQRASRFQLPWMLPNRNEAQIVKIT